MIILCVKNMHRIGKCILVGFITILIATMLCSAGYLLDKYLIQDEGVCTIYCKYIGVESCESNYIFGLISNRKCTILEKQYVLGNYTRISKIREDQCCYSCKTEIGYCYYTYMGITTYRPWLFICLSAGISFSAVCAYVRFLVFPYVKDYIQNSRRQHQEIV